MLTYRRVVLSSRSLGEPTAADFRVEEALLPEPKEDEVVLRILFLSIDPYMRGRMSAAKSYAEPVPIGGVMEGATIAKVVASRHRDFSVGNIVLSRSGWQEYALSDGSDLRKIDPAIAPITAWLGVLGMPGLTAYAGLLTIGQPRAGETVVVAAATGPVGSAVGQIAKIYGARAVGIASGPAKQRALLEDFGFDAGLDRRSPRFADELAAACPNGIDVYFENVGGEVLRAVLPLLNDFARVPICGLISSYNGEVGHDGRDRTTELLTRILTKRLTVRGFIVGDLAGEEPNFHRDMFRWLAAGLVKYREDVVDGLASAPEALIGLLRGKNFGKLLVRVAMTEETALE